MMHDKRGPAAPAGAHRAGNIKPIATVLDQRELIAATGNSQAAYVAERYRATDSSRRQLDLICLGCSKPFAPRRPDQRCCSAKCRLKAHRSKKRFGGVVGNGETHPHPPSRLPEAVAGQGCVEAKSSEPTSSDEVLIRIWGPNTLSEFQLRNMGLEATGLGFPGGQLYRRIAAL